MTEDELLLLACFRKLQPTWQRTILMAAAECLKLQEVHPDRTPRFRLLKGHREGQDDRTES